VKKRFSEEQIIGFLREAHQTMTRHQVRRVVVETSACVGSSRRTGRFAAGHIVHFILRDVMNDKERQEAFIRNSTLEWTIVRPARLSNERHG